ncbi:hypothetical protein VKT23_017690 [Stygiomarasmius scandens]|uniref:Uncharacterized protein n=1 Tax=Marasmiellus scandens TaxID=2682957 RepID=A0ABR1ITU1_9AGAR
MSAEASKNPELQQACRQLFGLVAQPMMDCIRSQTDFFCFTVAGCPPGPGETKFELAVYSSGTTVPRNGGKGLKVHKFRPDLFKTQVLNYFMDFLLETNSDTVPPQGLTHTLATETPDDLINPADEPSMLSFNDKDTDSVVQSDKIERRKEKNGKEERVKAKVAGQGEGKGKRKGKGKKQAKGNLSAGSDGDETSDESSTTLEVPRHSARPRPTPSNVKTFISRLPEDWLPLTVVDALNCLASTDLKMVLKELQTAADTGNVVEFNRALMKFTREYPSHISDAAHSDQLRQNQGIDSGSQGQTVNAVVHKDTSGIQCTTDPEPGSDVIARSDPPNSASSSASGSPQSTLQRSILDSHVQVFPSSEPGGIAVECPVPTQVPAQPVTPITLQRRISDSHVQAFLSSEPGGIAVETLVLTQVPAEPVILITPTQALASLGSDSAIADFPPLGSDESPDNLLLDFDRSGWPSWMTAAATYLEESLQNAGQVKQTLLHEWFVFERWHHYENPRNACYTSVGRPVAVGIWFKNGKKFRDFTPKEWTNAKVDSLAISWLAWWSTINPSWRARDKDNHIVLGNNEKGDWDELDKWGTGGFLSVIMCLVWWYQAKEKGGSDGGNNLDWSKAAEDVVIAL